MIKEKRSLKTQEKFFNKTIFEAKKYLELLLKDLNTHSSDNEILIALNNTEKLLNLTKQDDIFLVKECISKISI